MIKKLKNLTCIFKRYQNKYAALEHRFHAPERKSEEFMNKYYKVSERNHLQDILHPIETIEIGTTKYDFFSNNIYHFIHYFTAHNTYSDKKVAEIAEEIIKTSKKIKSIEYKDRDSCTIHLAKGGVQFTSKPLQVRLKAYSLPI